jgi:5'-nucleotidase
MKKGPAAKPEPQKLIIGISSRALFDLEMENRIFERQGVEAYLRYQALHEEEVLKPGVAFHLARTFLGLNKHLGKPLVEVCVLSRNTANSSLRLFNSFDAHHLGIRRVALTSGESISSYLKAFNVDLYLSANAETVSKALKSGVAAAVVYPKSKAPGKGEDSIRIALDGDGVLFNLDAENIFRTHGLDAFDAHERMHADVALPEGPLASFLKKISCLQRQLGDRSHLIKTALITSRGHPAHERVIKTLRSWNVRIDASFFLGGAPKAPIVQAFGANIFFDNQTSHCEAASTVAPTAQVLEPEKMPQKGNAMKMKRGPRAFGLSGLSRCANKTGKPR